jgi:hypothetical protein
MARRAAAAACLALLPAAAQCVSVALGDNQYVTAPLTFATTGCFRVSVTPTSPLNGTLFASVNTARQVARNGMTAPAQLLASELSFTDAAGPSWSYAYLQQYSADSAPTTWRTPAPEPFFSRWSSGAACLVTSADAPCWGVFLDGPTYAESSVAETVAANPKETWVLVVMYAPAAAGQGNVTAEVEVADCPEGVLQPGGIGAWTGAMPFGRTTPQQDACYSAYLEQLDGATLPVSPNNDTCLACGKVGACPVRASLFDSFYPGYEAPTALDVRPFLCVVKACMTTKSDSFSAFQAFGRVAYWQKCVPGGDGGAHLGGDETLAYAGGTYLFLDADGNLVERSIEWCKLEISADGLKLAIILPVGLVMSVGVVGLVANWYAKRQAQKLEAQNAEVKEKEERLSVPSLTAERVFQPGPTRAERISSIGVQAQAPRRVQVMDEAVDVDASQG